MNSSNDDKPSSADRRLKKRLLVVERQKRRADNQKTVWESTSEAIIKNDDRKRYSLQQKSDRGLRTIAWMLVGIATLSLAGIIATQIALKTKQVISATGQLTARGTIKEMQAPENKVVKTVFVKQGEQVKKGQPLVAFDSVISYEKLQSLENQRQLLVRQNQFYRLSLAQSVTTAQVERAILELKLPRETAFLVRNRTALIAANQQYQTQESEHSAKDAENLQASATQLAENNAQAESQKALAALTIRQLQESLTRNRSQQEEMQETLDKAIQKLRELRSLLREGAIARVEYVEQQQVVSASEDEIARLRAEEERLQLNLTQATEQLIKTPASVHSEVSKPKIDYQKQIADNKKQLAEIDSQLTKIVTENERQIAELDRQSDRVKPNSNSYILKAPADGTIIEVKASPGFGSVPDSEKALLKLQSDDRYLVVEVLIPKENLDFIQEGMLAEVKADGSPLGELGNLQGQILSVGSDALPPDAVNHFYGIPVKIGLEKQALGIELQKMPLRSRMSATVTININKKQTLGETLWQKLVSVSKLRSD
jgi:HlyD family secretion protein